MLVSGTADQEVRLGRAVQPVAAEKISGTRLRRPSSPRPEMARTRPSPKVTSVGYQRPPAMDGAAVHCSASASKVTASLRPKNGWPKSYSRVPPATSRRPSAKKACPEQKTSIGTCERVKL